MVLRLSQRACERSGIKEGAVLELDVAGDALVLRVKDSGVS